MLKTQSPQWPGIPKDEDNTNTDEVFEVGPNDPGAPGSVMCFAYALPYTYNELLSDLEMSKKFLLAHGGSLVNQQHQGKLSLIATKQPKTSSAKEERQILTKQ